MKKISTHIIQSITTFEPIQSIKISLKKSTKNSLKFINSNFLYHEKMLLPTLIVLPLAALSIFQNKSSAQELEFLVEDYNETSIVMADVIGINDSSSFTSIKEFIDKSIYTSSLDVISRDSFISSKEFTEKKSNIDTPPTIVFSSLNNLVEKYS